MTPMHEANIQRSLTRIQSQLRDLEQHPERTKFPQQVADERTLAALRLVVDLLPEAIRQPMTEILTLRDHIQSPYLHHATEMTSLHRSSEQHSDLPNWVQKEER